MSRRRSTNPTKAISLTIPQSVLDDIHDQIGYKASRSEWITEAARMRLRGSRTIADASDTELLVVLVNRGVIDEKTFAILTSSS